MIPANPRPLEYKPDWPASARRLEAWWDRQIVDRAPVQVTAPRNRKLDQAPIAPDDLATRWTDIDYVLRAAEYRMRSTYYAGDSYPHYFANLGPDVFAGYLGCPLEFGENTSWSFPIVQDWDDPPEIRLDPTNRWWRLTLEMTRAAAERFAGKCVLGLTDLHGGIDAVAALRDPQSLALDLIDHPTEVLRVVDALIPVWFEVYRGMHEIIKQSSPGTTSWLTTWSCGRSYPVSCDFICMISRGMFDTFVRKDLEAEIGWLDRAVFHLDGPQALRHLDTLLAMPRIHAIQWVPGANSGPALQWVPVLKRIQAKEKAIHMTVEPKEVLPLLEALDPRGVLLQTRVDSEAEADTLVAEVARIRIPGG
jgi:hypothetical protein